MPALLRGAAGGPSPKWYSMCMLGGLGTPCERPGSAPPPRRGHNEGRLKTRLRGLPRHNGRDSQASRQGCQRCLIASWHPHSGPRSVLVHYGIPHDARANSAISEVSRAGATAAPSQRLGPRWVHSRYPGPRMDVCHARQPGQNRTAPGGAARWSPMIECETSRQAYRAVRGVPSLPNRGHHP